MGDTPALDADRVTGGESAAAAFGVWSEGYIMDDDGCVVDTYQVNVPGPGSMSPASRWPLYRPILVKLCKEQDLIDACETLHLSRPTKFRDAGETLMSDPEEARVSLEWITDERLNDSAEMERARLLDEEGNRGAELIGSTMKSTTNEVKSRRSRRDTVDRGGSGWLWCSAIEPTNDADWERLCSDFRHYGHYWTFRSPRIFARALGLMVAEQLGPRGRMATVNHHSTGEVTHHKSQTVFHGPVSYVADPYGYVAESVSPLEHLLRPLFVKRPQYEHQREYRFCCLGRGGAGRSTEDPEGIASAAGDHTRPPVRPRACAKVYRGTQDAAARTSTAVAGFFGGACLRPIHRLILRTGQQPSRQS